MSNKAKWPHSNSLSIERNGIQIQLGYACDIVHGRCWMARAWDWNELRMGQGFSKNKFTAVRTAIKELKEYRP